MQTAGVCSLLPTGALLKAYGCALQMIVQYEITTPRLQRQSKGIHSQGMCELNAV